MKRDMELVRKILFALESHPHGFAPSSLSIDGHTLEEVGYHIHSMGQGGLLEVSDLTVTGCRSPFAVARSVTWSGHDFLDAVRSDTVWSKAKKKAKEKGVELGEMGFGVLVEFLKQQVKEQLGLSYPSLPQP